MNWRLVFGLSMFGLAMAVATVYVVPSNIEPIFWLVIFLVCAWLIAKRAPGKFFLHGFMTSLVNCVWITSAHVALYGAYVARHPAEVAMAEGMPLSPRAMMLVTGPIIGVVSGLVLGLFAFGASKIFRRSAVAA